MSSSHRCLHRLSSRCLSSFSGVAGGARPRRTRGSGGDTEERQIAQSLRTIRSREYPVVVEVLNASHVDWATLRLPSRRLLQGAARIWIRVLTHADLLSERALRHQMERASVVTPIIGDNNYQSHGDDPPHRIPVMALNLKDVDALSTKQVRSVMHMLAGAKMTMEDSRDHPSRPNDPNKLLICGLPNAGKSSLIYPLTKARTLKVKKKRDYHLPSVNATAGWTMGTKSHIFEIDKISVSLTDTPGLRPRLDRLSQEELAGWLATQSLKPTKGMLSENNTDSRLLGKKVVAALWDGLRRHAQVSSLPFEIESPEQLWSMHLEGRKKMQTHELIQACGLGTYGGMIMGNETPSELSQTEQLEEIRIDFNKTVVATNQAARLLIEVGAQRTFASDPENSVVFLPKMAEMGKDANDRHNNQQFGGERGKGTDAAREKKARGQGGDGLKPWHHVEEDGDASVGGKPDRIQDGHVDERRHRVEEDGAAVVGGKPNHDQDGNGHKRRHLVEDKKVIRLPDHQLRIECMKCAGFVKRNKLDELSGTYYPRITNWENHHILSFYSRMVEAFGFDPNFNSHGRYLMRDSLALTLKNKYKLTSRRKVYKKFRANLGGYPVPDGERPRRFRSDQPIPLPGPIECTNRSKSGCKGLSGQARAELAAEHCKRLDDYARRRKRAAKVLAKAKDLTHAIASQNKE